MIARGSGGCVVYEQQQWLSTTRRTGVEPTTPLSKRSTGNSFNPNQPSLKDLVLGQVKVQKDISKKDNCQ